MPYMKWKIKHVPKHQPEIKWIQITYAASMGRIPSPIHIKHPLNKTMFFCWEFPHSIDSIGTIEMGCLILRWWDYGRIKLSWLQTRSWCLNDLRRQLGMSLLSLLGFGKCCMPLDSPSCGNRKSRTIEAWDMFFLRETKIISWPAYFRGGTCWNSMVLQTSSRMEIKHPIRCSLWMGI